MGQPARHKFFVTPITLVILSAGIGSTNATAAQPFPHHFPTRASGVPVVRAQSSRLTEITDSSTGIQLALPMGIVSGPSSEKWGNNWSADDERLSIDTLNFRHQRSLSDVYRSLRDIRGRRLTGDVYETNRFVIQGFDSDGSNFYVEAEERGGEVRGISIVYSSRYRAELAPVVGAISRSFRAFPMAPQRTQPGATTPPPVSVPDRSAEEVARLQKQLEDLQQRMRAQEAILRQKEEAPKPAVPAGKASIPEPPQATPQQPKGNAGLQPERTKPGSHLEMLAQLQKIVDEQAATNVYLTAADISASGDVRIGLASISMASEPSVVKASPLDITGSPQNLMTTIDRDNDHVVHLVFHDPAERRQLILFSVALPSSQEARDWAARRQLEVDQLSALSGRASDPFAELKVNRRKN